ncbi:MAG: hypothetical protein ACXU8A_02405 [Burkholderiaceae bacterium]
MQKKFGWAIGLMIACVGWMANAHGRILIQNPAAFEADAPVDEGVKRQCGIELLVANQVFQNVSDRMHSAQQLAEPEGAGTDPFLKLTIIKVHGVGGGAWSGAKSITVRADLLRNTEVIASKVFVGASRGGAFNGLKGTCTIMELAATNLGQDIAAWLPSVMPTIPVPHPDKRATSPAPVEQPVTTARAIKQHRKQVPPASGFAAIEDASAVPVREAGRARYLHYLTLQSPKVFIVYPTGGWRFFWNDADAMTKALDYCSNEGATCWLYAVDDRVVWEPEIDKRISKSAQLKDK